MPGRLRRWLRGGCLGLLVLVVLLALFGWVQSTRLARAMRVKNVAGPGSLDVAVTAPDPAPFRAYLKRAARPAAQYVVGQFARHDVVILGEMHEVAESCQFVGSLVEPLYRAGVTRLYMESIKHKDTPLVSRLVTGREYDQALALRIFRDAGWPVWGFKEYIDILHAVWQLNRRLPTGAPPFLIVGLDRDWDGYDIECGGVLGKIRATLTESGRDRAMAGVVAREVFERHRKALVHIGYMHSFTRYRGPVVRNGQTVAELPPRFGWLLRQRYGSRVFQVRLHQDDFAPGIWTTGQAKLRPVLGGLLETAVTGVCRGPVGFDVVGSPFARLRDSQSAYFAYQRYVTLADIAEGYVLLRPIAELHKVSWQPGFIGPENFARARGVAEHRGWVRPGRCRTARQLDERLSQMYAQ